MEKKRNGLEALQNYSFRDVTLKSNDALTILTKKTMQLFKDNAKTLEGRLDITQPNNALLIERTKQWNNSPEKFVKPGGLSTNERELVYIYGEWGNLKFSEVIGKLAMEAFPQQMQDDPKDSERNSAITCMGYLLDMVRAIDHKIASFDNGVQAVMEAMRQSQSKLLSPFALGIMVDDSIHRRGTLDFQFDALADKDGAEEFKKAFLCHATDAEKKDFENGLNDYDELIRKNIGYSEN